MGVLLEMMRAFDTTASAWVEALRWGPLTVVFVLASTWWVKWPLLLAVGACGDCKCRRRRPRAAAAGLLAVGVAALLVTVFKDLFDRAGVSQVLEQHESRRRNHTYLIMALIILELSQRDAGTA